jgi:hypothetical protein
MSAIRPNLNFDNERQEHKPYKPKADYAEAFRRMQELQPTNKKLSPRVNLDAHRKWFKQ